VIEHGVRSLLLASRRGPEAPGALELEAELEELGAHVKVAACDVSDRDQLETLLTLVPEKFPLQAVLHAAGVSDNGLIDSLSPERIDSVLAAKADAAIHLHELTEHLDLSAFVLFSSLAATFGGPGQGTYAAANALLDALAAHRHARDLPGTSMAWGLWTDAGMGRHLGQVDMKRLVRSSSLSAISTKQGLELFDSALSSCETMIVPIPLDSDALRAEARAGSLPTLLRGLVRTPPRRANEDQSGSLARRLAAAPEDDRQGVVLEIVSRGVAAVLGHASPQAVDAHRTFKELGFDSLAAVELRNHLNTVSGLRLPATLVFDYPTPTELADYLVNMVNHDNVTPQTLVDAEFIKLERALFSPTAGDFDQTKIASRLQALLARVTSKDLVTVDENLESATVDEVLDLLDKERGLVPVDESGSR
jgi:pimaricinolide synthase PimS1